jgi:hypothetical protein
MMGTTRAGWRDRRKRPGNARPSRGLPRYATCNRGIEPSAPASSLKSRSA